MLGLILTILVVGAIAGFVARLLVPGRQELSMVAAIALGIVGSLPTSTRCGAATAAPVWAT